LGGPEHGRWLLAPTAPATKITRRYRGATLILETDIETADGCVRVTDFMPIRGRAPDIMRIVEGVRGVVAMQLELLIRYDYGSIVPWVRREGNRLHAVAGPDALVFASDVPTHGRGLATVAEFEVAAGECRTFTLTWHSSCDAMPASPDPQTSLQDTEAWWNEWVGRAASDGPYAAAVQRSLLTLKALTYAPSGGIVAAPTTSLPEKIGGPRNWDYRYCWLRDATLTLLAFLHAGHSEEAHAWRSWLVRTVAGEPAKLQVLYGVNGERRIEERELPWLPGYEGSKPVRVGNAAVAQLQLDVFGELMDALYIARSSGLDGDDDAWAIQRACVEWLAQHWQEPDEGIWEVRTERKQFTFSKVMAWVAFDRAVKTVHEYGAKGDVARWTALRDQIHAEVCARGYDPVRNTFTREFGDPALDASLLLIAQVGFLPPDDPRVLGTLEAIERELVVDGLVLRYRTDGTLAADGLPGDEGVFLACSFWLVDALVLVGRHDEAAALFERLLSLANDVGLLAEEYDPRTRRLVGNFPQAFSHVGLINSARNLCEALGPAAHRASSRASPARAKRG
ncbi:MAG TPA: glycoside hydrolase family 15 protein, partial [Kofleriaceae bacterium]|nr:glycoside hydrolase family 15 protein [Kofleriaceae bacterium]